MIAILIIETEFGNFGHPKDLFCYMKEYDIGQIHVKVQYCFEDVFEKDMLIDDVSRWAHTFISPVAGNLADAVKWLRLGGV